MLGQAPLQVQGPADIGHGPAIRLLAFQDINKRGHGDSAAGMGLQFAHPCLCAKARLSGRGHGSISLLKQVLLQQILSVQTRGAAVKPYYTQSNYSMRNSVGYLMRMGTNRVLPQMEALFADEELSFSQWTTLVALHDGRIKTAGDL